MVAHTAAELADDVAARLVAALATALRTRPLAHLVVTGGGILEQMMAALAVQPARDAVDWHRVVLWWGDERFVEAASPDRNDRAAFEVLFAGLPLDPANVHRMAASDGAFGDDPEAAAAGYAQELRVAAAADRITSSDGGPAEVPQFDVAVLGIGPDGHCASLFPEHPGVYETERMVIAVHNAPKPPPVRLSLTFPALDAANEVWFVASGEAKARAVALAHSGAGRVQVPAAGPRGRHRTLWLIDWPAAADLPHSIYRPPLS